LRLTAHAYTDTDCNANPADTNARPILHFRGCPLHRRNRLVSGYNRLEVSRGRKEEPRPCARKSPVLVAKPRRWRVSRRKAASRLSPVPKGVWHDKRRISARSRVLYKNSCAGVGGFGLLSLVWGGTPPRYRRPVYAHRGSGAAV